ncbi:SpoVT / AbrB-like protein [Pseudomonas amygdali pv. myricae]|nr:SpoVT / AbrB-like protein [Pseudomonas amygdali pv. myricae]
MNALLREHNESCKPDQGASNVMTEAQRWTVKCQDPADGSGDVIIEIPPDLLASLELSIGDALTIEVIDGAIVLTPKPRDSATP